MFTYDRRTGSVTQVPAPGQGDTAIAPRITEARLVVGRSTAPDGATSVFTHDTSTGITSAVSLPTGWNAVSSTGPNAQGRLLVQATNNANSQWFLHRLGDGSTMSLDEATLIGVLGYHGNPIRIVALGTATHRRDTITAWRHRRATLLILTGRRAAAARADDAASHHRALHHADLATVDSRHAHHHLHVDADATHTPHIRCQPPPIRLMPATAVAATLSRHYQPLVTHPRALQALLHTEPRSSSSALHPPIPASHPPHPPSAAGTQSRNSTRPSWPRWYVVITARWPQRRASTNRFQASVASLT